LVDKSTLDVPGFNRWCMDNGLQGCPGWTLGKSDVQHRVVLPWLENKAIDILPPKGMKEYPRDQSSYETKDPVDLKTFGPTTRGPMGELSGCSQHRRSLSTNSEQDRSLVVAQVTRLQMRMLAFMFATAMSGTGFAPCLQLIKLSLCLMKSTKVVKLSVSRY
jgi:hypothetical protein